MLSPYLETILQSRNLITSLQRQLHLVQEEVSRLKEQLKNVETRKGQALSELESANQTVEDLTQKLKVVCDSKDSAIQATEEANNGYSKVDGSWNLDLETAREQYKTAIAKLDAAKHEVRKMRSNCAVTIEEKAAVDRQAEEAKRATKANMERAGKVSREIETLQESIQKLKLASLHVKEDEGKVYAEKGVQRQSYKTRLGELSKELTSLRKEIKPALIKDLEVQLAQTMSAIEALRKEMDSARSSDLASVKDATTELNDAKESLHNALEEEGSQRSYLAELELELKNVKKEHSELMGKESETESLAGNLHAKLQRAKSELERALAEESKVRRPSEEMIATIEQVRLECENAKNETNEMKKQAEELKKETDSARITLEEAEKKLKVALEAAEEAKAAENRALDEIKLLSERASATRASTPESGAQITIISRDEFDFLSQKVGESERLAELKVAAAMAQVEAVRASENGALMRLEAARKEIDNMRTATQDALKRAEMDETAKQVVEGELRRWREREQKKVAEATHSILAETQKVVESFPHNYQNAGQGTRDGIESQTHNLPEVRHPRKLEKSKSSVPKTEKSKTSVAKKVLLRNVSDILPKRTRQVQVGSPYLPRENLYSDL
ncbi:PREDICTED: WEB family protein At5g55860-like isoform X2 [Ipomoea nil]|uniref:WEB family protein At5g55860-like isoform X2 n=1 Tax=Ipomoea nil TaxID=35883 RepID=UPI0009013C4B|nr:PREDICTED: WEB family protein At5g55860-like isoform X2 [Ipomoea nil]